MIEKVQESDIIAAPDHYVSGRKYEPRKVIRDWGLSFNLGNALKYISRAGRKDDAVQDLKKAKQYIDFEISDILEESAEKLLDTDLDDSVQYFESDLMVALDPTNTFGKPVKINRTKKEDYEAAGYHVVDYDIWKNTYRGLLKGENL